MRINEVNFKGKKIKECFWFKSCFSSIVIPKINVLANPFPTDNCRKDRNARIWVKYAQFHEEPYNSEDLKTYSHHDINVSF